MCDDEPAVLDFDPDELMGFEAGELKPSTRELEPRHERRLVAAGARLQKRGQCLMTPRLLNGDTTLGVDG